MSETLKEQGFSSTDARAKIQTQALEDMFTSELRAKETSHAKPITLIIQPTKDLVKQTGEIIPNALCVSSHIDNMEVKNLIALLKHDLAPRVIIICNASYQKLVDSGVISKHQFKHIAVTATAQLLKQHFTKNHNAYQSIDTVNDSEARALKTLPSSTLHFHKVIDDNPEQMVNAIKSCVSACCVDSTSGLSTEKTLIFVDRMKFANALEGELKKTYPDLYIQASTSEKSPEAVDAFKDSDRKGILILVNKGTVGVDFKKINNIILMDNLRKTDTLDLMKEENK